MNRQKTIKNSILGTALGDSIGLPFEALSRQKIAKKNPTFQKQSLFFGKGMFSDDTEQTLSVAQSLIESYDNVELFQKAMRRRLQLWFLAIPAGIGFATMRAIVKSFFVKKAGVFSAGNAPAMRSALLGILFGHDDVKLVEFVRANTELTHTDPKAYYGALAVAKASYLSSIDQEDSFFEVMKKMVDDREFLELLDRVEKSLHLSSLDFASKLGLEKGVGGYIYQTLPIVLHSWLRNRDNLKQAIIDVVLCGGDTDTTGAIVGSIVGAKAKEPPHEWIEGIIDFPRNLAFIEEVSVKLNLVFEEKKSQKAPRLSAVAILIRNVLFFLIVLVVAVTRQF
jgi:ADP-ribosylglycohydrolase